MTQSSDSQRTYSPPVPSGNRWPDQMEAERRRVAELVEALHATRIALADLESQLIDERVTASELCDELDAEYVLATADLTRLKATAPPVDQAHSQALVHQVAMAEDLVRAMDSAKQMVEPLLANLAALDYTDPHRA